MAIIANLSSIAAGISIGFSAIAIPSLMSKTNSPALNTSEISWIGKLFSAVSQCHVMLNLNI